MVMGSKGLHDSLDHDLAGDDRKSAMEAPITEEIMRLTVGRARWTPHDKNPADALTKFKGAHQDPLISLIKYGKCIPPPEQESLDERRQEEDGKQGTSECQHYRTFRHVLQIWMLSGQLDYELVYMHVNI